MNDNQTPKNGKKFNLATERTQMDKLAKDPESKFDVKDLMDASAMVGYRTAKQELIDFLVIQHNTFKPDETLPARAFLKRIIVALEKSGRG